MTAARSIHDIVILFRNGGLQKCVRDPIGWFHVVRLFVIDIILPRMIFHFSRLLRHDAIFCLRRLVRSLRLLLDHILCGNVGGCVLALPFCALGSSTTAHVALELSPRRIPLQRRQPVVCRAQLLKGACDIIGISIFVLHTVVGNWQQQSMADLLDVIHRQRAELSRTVKQRRFRVARAMIDFEVLVFYRRPRNARGYGFVDATAWVYCRNVRTQ
mmetsp:Transcript_12734/g.31085  ORF Transcript_12734/g.31085 Transcript_12734/m.31085 type:complete len:215 (+) Transcript_12734:1073-1717(+)